MPPSAWRAPVYGGSAGHAKGQGLGGTQAAAHTPPVVGRQGKLKGALKGAPKVVRVMAAWLVATCVVAFAPRIYVSIHHASEAGGGAKGGGAMKGAVVRWREERCANGGGARIKTPAGGPFADTIANTPSVPAEWRARLPCAPAAVLVAFCNKGMTDFAVNWAIHVRKNPALRRRHALVALDDELADALRDRGLGENVLRATAFGGATELVNRSDAGVVYFRQRLDPLRRMGAWRAAMLRAFLVEGYHVLLSDTDIAWVGDPWPFVLTPPPSATAADDEASRFAKLRAADVLVSVDLTNARIANDAGLIDHEHNVGMVFFRATARAVAFLCEWELRLGTEHAKGGTDQEEFNRIVKGMYRSIAGAPCRGEGDRGRCVEAQLPRWPQPPTDCADVEGCTTAWLDDAVTGAPRADVDAFVGGKDYPISAYKAIEAQRRQGVHPTFWLWHGRLAMGVLPYLSFPGGHSIWIENTPNTTGVKPVAIHATYTFGDTPQYAFGKRERFREMSLWDVESPGYYGDGTAEPKTPRNEGGGCRRRYTGKLCQEDGRDHGSSAVQAPRRFVQIEGLEAEMGRAVLALFDGGGKWAEDGELTMCKPGEMPSAFWAAARDAALAEEPGGASTSAPYDVASVLEDPAGRADPLEVARLGTPRCLHPRHAVGESRDGAVSRDPAEAHLAALEAMRAVLRNAFALAAALDAAVILPPMWCFCFRHWWMMDDCHILGSDHLVLPIRCPFDHAYEPSKLASAGLDYRSHTFLDHPLVPDAVRDSIARVEVEADVHADSPEAGDVEAAEAPKDAAEARTSTLVSSTPGRHVLRFGSRIEDAAAALTESTSESVLRVPAGHLLRLAPCWYRTTFPSPWSKSGDERKFLDKVGVDTARKLGAASASLKARLADAFKVRLQFCSAERNRYMTELAAAAKANSEDEYMAIVREFNCSGYPHERNIVDLGPHDFEACADDEAGPAAARRLHARAAVEKSRAVLYGRSASWPFDGHWHFANGSIAEPLARPPPPPAATDSRAPQWDSRDSSISIAPPQWDDGRDAAVWESLADAVQSGGYIMVTFATSAMEVFLRNWLASVRQAGMGDVVLVLALDDATLALCRGPLRCRSLRASKLAAMHLQTQATTEDASWAEFNTALAAHSAKNAGGYFSTGTPVFKRYSAVKTASLAALLEAGHAVIVSDSDTVWFRDPRPLFDAGNLQFADILVTSDCIDLDEDRRPPTGCQNTNHNTGTLLLRPTAARFAAVWHRFVAHSTDPQMRDQPTFNLLVRQQVQDGPAVDRMPGCARFSENVWFPPVVKEDLPRILARREGDANPPDASAFHLDATRDDMRYARLRPLFHAANCTLTMSTLPVDVFLNGHTLFVQHLDERRRADASLEPPVNVHCTYQYGDAPEFAYGKRQRLLESGLWSMEGGGNVEVREGESMPRYVTLAPRPVPPALAMDVESREALRMHFAEDRRMRTALRDTLALAASLNRTLGLPQPLYCFVDNMWKELRHGRVVPTMRLPYVCPMDHLFDLPRFHKNIERLQLPHGRAGLGFASADEVAEARALRGVVRVLVRRPPSCEVGPVSPAPAPYDVEVCGGLTADGWRRRLLPYKRAAVVELTLLDAHAPWEPEYSWPTEPGLASENFAGPRVRGATAADPSLLVQALEADTGPRYQGGGFFCGFAEEDAFVPPRTFDSAVEEMLRYRHAYIYDELWLARGSRPSMHEEPDALKRFDVAWGPPKLEPFHAANVRQRLPWCR